MNNLILSIDTGSEQSGVVLAQTCCTGSKVEGVIFHAKMDNDDVIDRIKVTRASLVLLERLVFRGTGAHISTMKDLLPAKQWEGRFIQECSHNPRIKRLHGITRTTSTKGLGAGDKAIRAALIAKYGSMAKELKTTDERAALAVAHRFTIATPGEREGWRL